MLRLLRGPVRLVSRLRTALRVVYYRASGVEIGASTYLSPGAYLDVHPPGRISIGENCYITRNVVILCHSDTRRGGPRAAWSALGGGRDHGDVRIGNNVFIGVNSVVMPGVSIGDDVVIGALSLVDSDIPSGKVAVGAPARVVGETRDHVVREPGPAAGA